MSAITPSDEMAKANAEYKRLHSDCPPKENKEECPYCDINIQLPKHNEEQFQWHLNGHGSAPQTPDSMMTTTYTKDLLEKHGVYSEALELDLLRHWENLRNEVVALAHSSGRREERQFILNILDGIDIADEEMGNKGGGTKAIRHALESRIID